MNVDDTRAFLREKDQRIPSKNWEILEEDSERGGKKPERRGARSRKSNGAGREDD
jgi:hypothetical protein